MPVLRDASGIWSDEAAAAERAISEVLQPLVGRLHREQGFSIEQVHYLLVSQVGLCMLREAMRTRGLLN